MFTVAPHLWFDNSAAEAVAFYLSVFPDSEVVSRPNQARAAAETKGTDPGPIRHDDSMQVIDFRIGDLRLSAFNGGPHHEFNDSISLAVTCPSQNEADLVWDALTAEDGRPLTCGWVRDKYGVAWQIIPAGLDDLLGHPDPEKANRAIGALLGMAKIDLAEIELAMNGE